MMFLYRLCVWARASVFAFDDLYISILICAIDFDCVDEMMLFIIGNMFSN